MNSGSSPSRRQLMQYALLAVPLAFAGIPLYLHAPDFYATEHGLSLGLIGVLLLLIRIFDAVQDPFIGIWSDRLRHRRLHLMLAAMLMLALGFFLLFSPSDNHTALWFVLSMLLATTAYSVLGINLNALGGMWGTTPAARTRIAGWREAFGLLGLVLASILPVLLMETQSKQHAFLYLTLALAFLLLVCGALFVRWYRGQPALENFAAVNDNPLGRRASLRPQRGFFAIYLVSALASAIPVVLVMFFIRDRLEAESYAGLFLLLYFVSGALSMALWQPVAKRIGKFRAWLAGMLLAIVSFIWAFTLEAGDVVPYAIICLTSGLALGAELALPPSILADRIEQQGAQQHTTLHFAVLVFLAKASLALASGIVLPALGGLGYSPVAENAAPALFALSLAYALLPCLIKALAAVMLWRFMLHHPSHAYGDIYAPQITDSQLTGSRYVP